MCAPDPDNNVFLLCCALRGLKSISLSEVWYHFVDEETKTLKLRALVVIIVKFELRSYWFSYLL